MFSISSSNWCWERLLVPYIIIVSKPCSGNRNRFKIITLKAKCSRKCAVPFVLLVSALLPASIHTPTVEV